MDASSTTLTRPLRTLDPRVTLGLFLVFYVLIWTAYGDATHATVHPDMAEAWFWGKEFQLGYYKHPFLFAWEAGAWFQIFPRATWSFYLLSTVNSALALVGVWFLAGEFLKGADRLASVLLLYLTPFYTFLALKFNANTALLALWPWASYYFVRAVRSRHAMDGAIFGVLCGLAMLTKYYSALFLVSCALASIVHPERGKIWRSPAPYAGLFACALIFAPHVWWVIQHGFPTINYALQKSNLSTARLIKCAVGATIGAVLLQVLPFAAFLGATRSGALTALSNVRKFIVQENTAWIAVMSLGPFVLTILCGFAGLTQISTDYMIPIFYMVPLTILVSNPQCRIDRIALQTIVASAAVSMMAALPAALLIYSGAISIPGNQEPRMRVVAEASSFWRRETGKPLKIVAGSWPYASMFPFYDPDGPSNLVDLSYSRAPWITPEQIAHKGILIVCEETDDSCITRANGFVNQGFTKRQEVKISDAKSFVFFALTSDEKQSAEGQPDLVLAR